MPAKRLASAFVRAALQALQGRIDMVGLAALEGRNAKPQPAYRMRLPSAAARPLQEPRGAHKKAALQAAFMRN